MTTTTARPGSDPAPPNQPAPASGRKVHTPLDEGKPLLQVSDLAVSFDNGSGPRIQAVDGVRMTIYPRQTLAVVGESGCGKSVSAMSLMHLIPRPPGRFDRGQAWFHTDRGPRDLLTYSESEIRSIRGNEIAMIFQEPMTSLNPVYTIGDQIIEAILLHQNVSGNEAVDIAVEAMRSVGIKEPEKRLKAYPHQFSGGMRQRVMIAMALSCDPKLLIADEPTTALDVTIQAQIIELAKKLRDQLGMAMIWISHDLGVVAGLSDTVQVMYGGTIVERGPVTSVFKDTRHPYTLGLLKSLPRHDMRQGGEKLTQIEGSPPDMRIPPKGCPFFARCTYRIPGKCDVETPPLVPGEGGDPNHIKACWVDVRTAVPVPLQEGVV